MITTNRGSLSCAEPKRGLTARREGADLIVSIHADGAAAGASGFHVIRAAPGPTVAVDVADRSAALGEATRDALVARGLTPATYVGGERGIVERTDIATLNRAGVPGVMVECGNMHDPGDLVVLASPEGRGRIADALASAVVAHLTRGR